MSKSVVVKSPSLWERLKGFHFREKIESLSLFDLSVLSIGEDLNLFSADSLMEFETKLDLFPLNDLSWESGPLVENVAESRQSNDLEQMVLIDTIRPLEVPIQEPEAIQDDKKRNESEELELLVGALKEAGLQTTEVKTVSPGIVRITVDDLLRSAKKPQFVLVGGGYE